MRMLHKWDVPEQRLSEYFVGYDHSNELGRKESIIRWHARPETALELQHEWGTEDDPNFKAYHTDPLAGFGHFALAVPDVQEAFKYFESMNVTIVMRPQESNNIQVAFIADPDGYLCELLQKNNN